MRMLKAPILLAAAMLSLSALPADAHKAKDPHVRLLRPYVIEKSCNDGNLDCWARMRYAPGENPGLAGYGSYWFPYQGRKVRVFNEDHVHWCLARYKTYDPHSDTFIGKGHRTYRCNSPYDGV